MAAAQKVAAPSGEKGVEDAKKKVATEIGMLSSHLISFLCVLVSCPFFPTSKTYMVVDQIRKKKYLPLRASLHEAGDGIRKLRISAFRGDPQRAATDTKIALGKQGRVRELAEQFAAQAQRTLPLKRW